MKSGHDPSNREKKTKRNNADICCRIGRDRIAAAAAAAAAAEPRRPREKNPPTLDRHGGQLVRINSRVAHRLCVDCLFLCVSFVDGNDDWNGQVAAPPRPYANEAGDAASRPRSPARVGRRYLSAVTPSTRFPTL